VEVTQVKAFYESCELEISHERHIQGLLIAVLGRNV